MLIECQHCGAPLDVRTGAETSRCRYCSSTTRVASTKLLSPETPAEWRPPPRWRPPAEVAADSNVELAYQGSHGGIVAGVVVGLLVVIAVPFVIALEKAGVIGGVAAADFDAVTFTEEAAALKAKIGGTLSDDGKWLSLSLQGPFRHVVFSWDDKDRSHPSSLSMHTPDQTQCSPELEAIRAKLRKDLGPRFDGTSWRWGPTYLNFDAKCASFSFGASVGDGENEGWRAGVEALWTLVSSDVFGRSKRPSVDALAGVLGVGYSGAKIASVVQDTTIDDGPAAVRARLPGAVFRQLAGLEAQLPIAGTTIGEVDVEWENKKAGGLRSLNARTFGGELTDHLELARCLAKSTEARVDVRETDYVKKTSDASLTIAGATVNVSKYGFHVFGSNGAIPGAAIGKLLVALDACQ